jgi:ADP-heptose:LPS heptosyltransferase
MQPVDLNRVERLLILKVSSMGDLVHASPVAAALKRAFPHLYIGWVAEDRHAGVLADSPRIDRLHIIPHRVLRERPFRRAAWQAVLRLARELHAEQYQVALDLQGLLKSAIWGVLGGIPLRYGAHRMRELTPLLLRRIPIPDRPDRLWCSSIWTQRGGWVRPASFPTSTPRPTTPTRPNRLWSSHCMCPTRRVSRSPANLHNSAWMTSR